MRVLRSGIDQAAGGATLGACRWPASAAARRARAHAPVQRGRAGLSGRHRGRRNLAHSITLSARARIVGGIVRLSSCAVLRLTTKSNLTGSWMGRWAASRCLAKASSPGPALGCSTTNATFSSWRANVRVKWPRPTGAGVEMGPSASQTAPKFGNRPSVLMSALRAGSVSLWIVTALDAAIAPVASSLHA